MKGRYIMKICIDGVAVLHEKSFFPFKPHECKKKMLYLVILITQIKHKHQHIKVNNMEKLTQTYFNTKIDEVKAWNRQEIS